MHTEHKITSGQTTALTYAHIQQFLQVLTAMNHHAFPQLQGLDLSQHSHQNLLT